MATFTEISLNEHYVRGQTLEEDPDNTSVGETLWTTLVRFIPHELVKGMSGLLALGKYVDDNHGF